jgi:uridine kinase
MQLTAERDTLLKIIRSWSLSDEKIVIGIDGYSGAGKTTLLHSIEKHTDDFLVVNRDDFAIPREQFKRNFEKMNSETEKIHLLVDNTIDVEELVSLLKTYKTNNEKILWNVRDEISGIKDKKKRFDFSKKVLIIEGIFLFHSNELADLLDKKIFINIDPELADSRRRNREMKKWGKDYFPDTHPDSYSRLIKIGFIDYLMNENPIAQADFVINKK